MLSTTNPMYRTQNTTPTAKPTNAHLPASLALVGIVFCHTKNNIRPIIGNIKHKPPNKHPRGPSTELPIVSVLVGMPQPIHTTARSSSCLPQLEQYISYSLAKSYLEVSKQKLLTFKSHMYRVTRCSNMSRINFHCLTLLYFWPTFLSIDDRCVLMYLVLSQQ